MHGRLAIISLRPDICRVDCPVLHARTMNDAIFSMMGRARGPFAHARSLPTTHNVPGLLPPCPLRMLASDNYAWVYLRVHFIT